MYADKQALFALLQLSEYLEIFNKQKLTAAHLLELSNDELAGLIPEVSTHPETFVNVLFSSVQERL